MGNGSDIISLAATSKGTGVSGSNAASWVSVISGGTMLFIGPVPVAGAPADLSVSLEPASRGTDVCGRGPAGPASGWWPGRFAAADVPAPAAASPGSLAIMFFAEVPAVPGGLVSAVSSGESGVRNRVCCWLPGSAALSSSSWRGVEGSDIMIEVYFRY